jgi:hypothetical protein
LPPCDVDQVSGRARLSYRQAEDLLKAASGGATLRQLAGYARPSAEALARWQERNDPARRR